MLLEQKPKMKVLRSSSNSARKLPYVQINTTRKENLVGAREKILCEIRCLEKRHLEKIWTEK